MKWDRVVFSLIKIQENYIHFGALEANTVFWEKVERYWGFSSGSVVKNPPANAGDMGLISGWGRFAGEGNDNLFQ